MSNPFEISTDSRKFFHSGGGFKIKIDAKTYYCGDFSAEWTALGFWVEMTDVLDKKLKVPVKFPEIFSVSLVEREDLDIYTAMQFLSRKMKIDPKNVKAAILNILFDNRDQIDINGTINAIQQAIAGSENPNFVITDITDSEIPDGLSEDDADAPQEP